MKIREYLESKYQVSKPTFDAFWEIYPRKVAKKDAARVWARMSSEQRFAATQALPIHIRYWEAAGRTKETTPHPATWLNGERWTDELEMPAPVDAMGEWWKSTAGIQRKAQSVGITAKAGEDWHALKARILAKERAA